jgi:hypothetical protein
VLVTRPLVHQEIVVRLLDGQRDGGRAVREQIKQQKLDGFERHGLAQSGGGDHDEERLGHVLRQQHEDENGDVAEDRTAYWGY